MTYKAKIILDSISDTGVRLTTFEVTLPRKVLAEYNTHKIISKNSASSRAIPVKKMLKMVQENPYVPSKWGKNQRGMQAYQDVLPEEAVEAEKAWLKARDLAVAQVERLLDLGIHKQIANRLLEPFMWHTILSTATEWSNFFNLRNNPEADPDIQVPAKLMQDAYEKSTPNLVKVGDWHLPLIYSEDLPLKEKYGLKGLIKVSIGRCARVSYLTHDGVRDWEKDIELYDRLMSNGHLSPAEHVATPYEPYNSDHKVASMIRVSNGDRWFGNFRGWVQYRKLVPNEFDYGRFLKQNGS